MIALIILTAYVQTEIDVKKKLQFQAIQLFDRNASYSRVVSIGIKIVIKSFCC